MGYHIQYLDLEKKFNVIHASRENATYTSLVNFSEESNKFRQRWYRYKEGYSTELVEKIIKKYNKNPTGIILDPFLGSGTTAITANNIGLKAIGFEVNPFSFFLSTCKLSNYNLTDLKKFQKVYKEVLHQAKELSDREVFELPKLSISHKTFHPNVQNYFMAVEHLINSLSESDKIKSLCLLGWLSCLEKISLYRKAGNGLKKKVLNDKIINQPDQAEYTLEQAFESIAEDIFPQSCKFETKIYQESALLMEEYISPSSISGVVFSPPYANAFDYTEIYKLELWFGRFVNDYEALKDLRQQSIRSHLNGLSINTVTNNLKTLPFLDILIAELRTKKLWDKKIPLMLQRYFHEMFSLLESIFLVLENNGFCSIVVANSSYGGVIFPTDLLIASYAELVGFKVDEIIIDRYIITSSQQYHTTLDSKRFLRESIICLTK